MILIIWWLTDGDREQYIEKINALKDNETLYVYVDSAWWSLLVRDVVHQMIENIANERKVVMYGVYLVSCWFDIFYYFSGEKYILPSAYGMIHMNARPTELWPLSIPRGELDRFKVRCTSRQALQDYTSKLTQEELDIVQRWDDLRMDYDTLCSRFGFHGIK